MRLPLFPLNTVLFPGATLPLQIFEERYKQMIRECLEGQQPFGVLLIRSGSEVGSPAVPFEVGTTAHILQVQHLAEGRLNLICVGGQRFRLHRTVQMEPYPVGEVETLICPPDEDAETADLADTAGALFAEYYRLQLALSDQWTRQVTMPADPGRLADFIAARLSVGLWTKQCLLEELSVKRRLEREVEILSEAIRELTPRVEAKQALRWYGLGMMN